MRSQTHTESQQTPDAVKSATHDSVDGDWTDICALEDIVEDYGVCAQFAGEQIAIFRLSDSEQLYALSNFDPFSEANVLSRGVVGDLKGALVVASPIFKQHFNLQTGQCLEDVSVTLKTYPVRVVDGRVQVSGD